MFFDDLPFPRLARDSGIAVGKPACVEALTDAPGLSPANLVCVVFASESTHQASEADENRVGDAVVNGTNFDV